MLYNALLAAAVAVQVDYMRIELECPGGPMPFVVARGEDGAEAVVNGVERVPLVWGQGDGARVARFEVYGSSLMMRRSGLAGAYITKRGDDEVSVPFTVKGATTAEDRFDATGEPVNPAFAGRWRVGFESSEDDAVGVFEVDAQTGVAAGTFLTTTGDYRYLAGRVDGDLMRLSTFDGAHAFLFHARLTGPDAIAGDFWSGTWHHEAWTAVRDDDFELPDAFGLTRATGKVSDLLGRTFDSVDGPRRVRDVYEPGRPTLIYVFGTWCPNCMDAAMYLKDLVAAHGEQGLRVIAVAFEQEAGAAGVERVRAYQRATGVPWPVLVGGLRDKAQAGAALGLLDGVRSYPTTVFIDKAGVVRGVYQGFSGPATGEAYATLKKQWASLIAAMLRE